MLSYIEFQGLGQNKATQLAQAPTATSITQHLNEWNGIGTRVTLHAGYSTCYIPRILYSDWSE